MSRALELAFSIRVVQQCPGMAGPLWPPFATPHAPASPTYPAQSLGEGCPGKPSRQGTLQLKLTSEMLTAWASADHTPCSWTANISLKGHLDAATPCLPQRAYTLNKKAVQQSISNVCHGPCAEQQHLCQILGNPALVTGAMGKAYNCNIMMIAQNRLDLEENPKAYQSKGECSLPTMWLTINLPRLKMETFLWFLISSLTFLRLFHIHLLSTHCVPCMGLDAGAQQWRASRK